MRDGFDRTHDAIARSRSFAAAVRAAQRGLPEWLVPFNTLAGDALARIERALALRPSDTLVDLGCGTGGVGVWLAERSGAGLIGVDFSPAAIAAAIRIAASRPLAAAAQFVEADATATGLPAGCATAGLSVDALMFMDPGAGAREAARILAPGGIIVVTAAETLGEPFLPTLVNDYTIPFENAGFRIREHDRAAGDATQLALYAALLERAGALREELGDAADELLTEAASGIERAREGTKRVRNIFLVAERI